MNSIKLLSYFKAFCPNINCGMEERIIEEKQEVHKIRQQG